MQLVAIMLGCTLPAGHLAHSVPFPAAENVPRSQAMHTPNPSSPFVPGGHTASLSPATTMPEAALKHLESLMPARTICEHDAQLKCTPSALPIPSSQGMHCSLAGS
eukprot:gb/GEZJ01010983.1/.p2 GENE.gb/GEZJ01010983.1/~~gb/GEZJ01010983.1/.p2  ORF type:complete len:106 (+),score=5.62 gb/GEZJ01010983.1/:126-443(+)